MTRSASVTIPTGRPPLLTTGTPGSSCVRSSRTTVSTSSSGETVTGSRSMMSPTVRAMARGPYRPSPRPVQGFDDVAGDDAVDAALARRMNAGPRVETHAGAGGGERVDPAREDRRDHAAQDVAGARGGERRARAGADRHRAVRLGDK